MFFFIGRIFISLVFLFSGVQTLLHWSREKEVFAASFSDLTLTWHLPFMEGDLISLFISLSPVLLGLSIVLRCLGGLCLFLGCFVRFGAALLLIFLIPMTLIFHSFWMDSGREFWMQLELFLNNLALIGALMIVSLGSFVKSKSI